MEEKMPGINIGGLEIDTCIIQGGMGVNISKAGLASAVANNGGVGNIATVGLGDHENFDGSYAEANVVALVSEIKRAREMSNGRGVIAANVMYALSDYDTLIKTIVREKVPLLFTGAGFDADLPKKIEDSDTMPVPVISYAKFIPYILKEWGEYNYSPAAIVIEGPKAGGHLGYGRRRLETPSFVESSLEREVKRAVEKVKGLNIPIIAAGGIYTGADIYEALGWGAKGVQMGTRFVVTDECDADIRFKQVYLDAEKEDIILIDSPVGFPGRAIKNAFLERVMSGERDDFSCPYRCLRDCKPKESPYCIADALKKAGEGNFGSGFAFAGTNAYRCDKIIPVKELMDTLGKEYSEAVVANEKK